MASCLIGQFQQQGKYRLRHIGRAVAGNIADRDATVTGSSHIDNIDASGQHRNQPQLRERRQRLS
jgi:hypothetical protein